MASFSIATWYLIAGSASLVLARILIIIPLRYYGPSRWLYRMDQIRPLMVLYTFANIGVFFVPPRDLGALQSRAANISLVNMMILFIGGRTSLLLRLWNVRYQTYQKWHSWIGLVVIAESILHGAFARAAPKADGKVVNVGWAVSVPH